MKNIVRFTKTILILVLFVSWAKFSNAQGPPTPPGDNGLNTNQPAGPGGGAPIGSGIAILLSLGAAWGGKKAYQAFKTKE